MGESGHMRLIGLVVGPQSHTLFIRIVTQNRLKITDLIQAPGEKSGPSTCQPCLSRPSFANEAKENLEVHHAKSTSRYKCQAKCF